MALDDLINPAFKQTILKKHEEDAEWLHTLPLPLQPYGYEWLYKDDPDRFFEIKNSDDYFVRYRPDYLTEIGGAPFLLELKSRLGWIQALSLAFNASALSEKRPFPTFYIIQRSFGVCARDLLQHQTAFFSHLQFWEKKEKGALSERWMKELRRAFHDLEEKWSSEDVGWKDGVFLRSGDPALSFKKGAPLQSWENFLMRISK